MKIIKNIEQGSDEWLKLRLGVATASNFSKIITGTGKESATLKKYAFELAGQSLLNIPEETYKSALMARGNELEPQALEAYQEYSFNAVEQITFMSCGDFGYSPDGLVNEDGLIEIKCPIASTHAKYLTDDKLPNDYIPQVQGGLYISKRKWCDFVSYHPDFKDDYHLFVKRVFRDEEYISKLAIGIDKIIKLRDEILTKIKNK